MFFGRVDLYGRAGGWLVIRGCLLAMRQRMDKSSSPGLREAHATRGPALEYFVVCCVSLASGTKLALMFECVSGAESWLGFEPRLVVECSVRDQVWQCGLVMGVRPW